MNKMSQSSQQNSINSTRGTEVFVGGLAHTVTEARIREIFSAFGEIIEIRMIKDKKGNMKGFCFVRFATKESADKAVKEKSGYVLDGKEIGVLPSIEQDTLFLGNLHKGWNAEEFENIVRQVFPDVVSVDLRMLGDVQPGAKHRNRGFGFVKFASHAAAGRAYRAGSLSDFVLAGNVHPSVKWADEEPEYDPAELAKIKIAFVRSLPTTANENYLKKLFEPFGKVDKVVLSRKGNSHVGFVHFDKRKDLDNALKEMNEKTVQGPDGGPIYKLQVELARPMEKKRKRAPEDLQSKAPSKIQSHSALQQDDLRAKSPGVHGFRAQQGVERGDPYEDAVIALPIAIKDRLLRILRLGIATRFDIDIESLARLKELPESTAISILDQFMISGAEMQDKGAYLAGLIHRVTEVRRSQLSMSLPRAESTLTREPELSSFSSRVHLPAVDSFASHVGLHVPRSDVYTSRYSPSYSDNYLSSRVTLGRRVMDASLSPLHAIPSSSMSNVRHGLSSHIAVPTDPRVRLSSHIAMPADPSLSPLPTTASSFSAGNSRIGLNSHTATIADQRSPSPAYATPTSSTDNVRFGLKSHIVDSLADGSLSHIDMISTSAAYDRVGLTSHVAPPADQRYTPMQMPPISSRAYDMARLRSDELPTADRQPPRTQVRFDPFTGKPYKFDPFTGEPILPESSSRRF